MDALLEALAHSASAIWTWVWPSHNSTEQPLPAFLLGSVVAMARNYFWFMAIGLMVYLFWVRRLGERFSVRQALRYLLPIEIYRTPSVRIDLMMVPIAWLLNFVLFAGLSVGSGVVQLSLVEEYGAMPWQVPAGLLAISLQVVFTLLGTDIARFAWHYQGHKVAFFWEFHKGHHSAEALHPVFLRTHPVDMFIRLLYMNVGGGLLGGLLMYLAGVQASAAGAGVMLLLGTLIHFFQQFEHSHIKISFGRRLDRIFYPPYFHQIHHSALLEHRDRNLGLTGGLCLWDQLAGTLYVPKADERIVYGASLEELGDNNPHRTLGGFLGRPFIEAWRVLWRRATPDGSMA